MSETKRSQRAMEFVEALRRIQKDRGKMAALRRSLTDNPRMHVDAWPVIASLGGNIDQPVYGTIAGLFALHPKESEARNFGETCRAIAENDQKEVPESFERRFRRLLSSNDTVDLAGQLRAWTQLASSRSVGINFEKLFSDLWNWQWYADEIRVRWASSFWRAERKAKESAVAEGGEE